MGNTNEQIGMGWFPDLPDYRDYSPEHEKIKENIQKLGLAETENLSLKANEDLRQWCSPIQNQGSLGSCTAQAGVGLIEFYERKAFGNHIDASKLFLYKVTRKLLGWAGDTGAYMKTTMGAMVLFGVPPEKHWPYTTRMHPGPAGERTFDDEPPAFLYAYGQNYQTLKYFRLDPPGIAPAVILQRIKAYISAKLPSFFGFTVYDSYLHAATTGKIPFPCPGERIRGGHGVVAVGFDDAMKIKNTTCGSETKGAILFRNSWGASWGDAGYGWLPYDYVLKGMARDWWVLFKAEYVPTGQFGI